MSQNKHFNSCSLWLIRSGSFVVNIRFFFAPFAVKREAVQPGYSRHYLGFGSPPAHRAEYIPFFVYFHTRLLSEVRDGVAGSFCNPLLSVQSLYQLSESSVSPDFHRHGSREQCFRTTVLARQPQKERGWTRPEALAEIGGIEPPLQGSKPRALPLGNISVFFIFGLPAFQAPPALFLLPP